VSVPGPDPRGECTPKVTDNPRAPVSHAHRGPTDVMNDVMTQVMQYIPTHSIRIDPDYTTLHHALSFECA
jgi:hypothetical protein